MNGHRERNFNPEDGGRMHCRHVSAQYQTIRCHNLDDRNANGLHADSFCITITMSGSHKSRRQVSRATKFCTEAPNICGRSVWDLFHDTILAPKILRWLLNFCKIFVPLYKAEFIIARRSTVVLIVFYLFVWGTAIAQWLRYCATNRKVAGSIPDGVIGIFH